MLLLPIHLVTVSQELWDRQARHQLQKDKPYISYEFESQTLILFYPD